MSGEGSFSLDSILASRGWAVIINRVDSQQEITMVALNEGLDEIAEEPTARSGCGAAEGAMTFPPKNQSNPRSVPYCSDSYFPGSDFSRHYARNRNYSPSPGRFITQDPLQFINGANTYQFVMSNPVGHVDPWGEATAVVDPVTGASFNWPTPSPNTAAWDNDFSMLGRWMTGTGPAALHFGPNSVPTQQMEKSPGVVAALAYFFRKNAGRKYADLLKVRHYDYKFCLNDIFTANATEQFVGSYRVNIVPTGNGLLTMTIWNKTSMTSAAYHLAPSWSRSTFGPGGNMVETFTWAVPYSKER